MDSHLKKEKIQSIKSVGRILSDPVFARISSPHFFASAMDGIAVVAEDTYGATENTPKKLKIGEQGTYVNTGNVMPAGKNAVIMIEHINQHDTHHITIESAVYPWQNVRKVGEDVVATELLFPKNHKITPYCIGALLTAGVSHVWVKEKPRVLIIPTGSELLDWKPDQPIDIEPGDIIESNSYVLGELVKVWGGEFFRAPIIADDHLEIKKTLLQKIKSNYHLIMVIGGSSAGSKDLAKKIINEIGHILVHGVTIMPGKPLIISDVQGKPVFGIPGYPVSAIMAFENFVGPLIAKMLSYPAPKADTISVLPIKKISSKLGIEEFVRVKLGKINNKIVASPLPRAAGCITSLTEANGIIQIPTHIEGLNEFEAVQARLLTSLQSIENTIIAVGSHDLALDILGNFIRTKANHITLASSHVGSLGGIIAVKKGVCHFAGSHLLDIHSGDYNISYLQKYVKNIPVVLINLVHRDQGLIIHPNNPKRIQGIQDLVKTDVNMINRQSGSGTRILLDYQLSKLGINPKNISGYSTEEYTHMAVAAAVKSGMADVGLGILAAAKALQLKFIPVVTERYDLVIPKKHLEQAKIKMLLDAVQSNQFKKYIEKIGGYHTNQTGQLIWESF